MRKLAIAILGIASIVLIYYLFIQTYEFKVNFSAKTTPGDVIETLRIWDRSMDSSEVVAVDSFSRLEQTIHMHGRAYVYDWRFRMEGDSVTAITINISEPGRRFLNKVLIPFTNQQIEVDAATVAKAFYGILKKHLEITRVRIVGEARVDSKFCACTTIETRQVAKANGMMIDFPMLTSFVHDFEFQTDGLPIVRITRWSHNRGELAFDFCFPVIRTDSLPAVDGIVYKTLPGFNALKAEYYGNYITSDRAWYALIEFARKNRYKTTELPIEFFHNNPNMGMNELEWKADVYLPLIN